MTHGLLSLVLSLGNELVWGEVAQGLMRAYGVVGVVPGQELLVQGGHRRVKWIPPKEGAGPYDQS